MTKLTAVEIRLADSPAAVDTVRSLFREYSTWLGVDLCFQSFEQELQSLPGPYSPPSGGLWLASSAQQPAGVVGMRAITDDTCEMKRLWVREPFRGTGLGERLARTTVEAARDAGYRRMRLHTLERLEAAIALYTRMGFRRIAPFAEVPEDGVVFMELDLRSS